METAVLVSSDRNIRDHLCRGSPYFGRNTLSEIHCPIFDKPVVYCN